jgi:hypothetical protein
MLRQPIRLSLLSRRFSRVANGTLTSAIARRALPTLASRPESHSRRQCKYSRALPQPLTPSYRHLFHPPGVILS